MVVTLHTHFCFYLVEEEEEDDDPWAEWANSVLHQFEDEMKERSAELEEQEDNENDDDYDDHDDNNGDDNNGGDHGDDDPDDDDVDDNEDDDDEDDESDDEYVPGDAVWKEFLPDMNGRLQEKLINFIDLHRHLRADSTFRKIMKTAKRNREEDDMDHEEAMVDAVKRRRLLLDRVLEKFRPS